MRLLVSAQSVDCGRGTRDLQEASLQHLSVFWDFCRALDFLKITWYFFIRFDSIIAYSGFIDIVIVFNDSRPPLENPNILHDIESLIVIAEP